MHKPSFSKGQFIAAAFEKDQLPNMLTLSGTPMLEIAIVGRSNVGKSSLINSLFKGKKLAKTSSTPGKTQSINFFSVDDAFALVDLPGYGYAKVSPETKKKWATLIDGYLTTRTSLRLILFLIDSRRTPTEEDLQFIQWAAHRSIPVLLIFTKADKINAREKKETPLLALKQFQQFLPAIRSLHYSIKDPCARNELIHQISSSLN